MSQFKLIYVLRGFDQVPGSASGMGFSKKRLDPGSYLMNPDPTDCQFSITKLNKRFWQFFLVLLVLPAQCTRPVPQPSPLH